MQQNMFENDRPTRVGQAKDIKYYNTSDILTKASGFMDEYDFTLNPYSGCTFGCTYCYAAFFSRNKEKQNNWGKWVSVKQNAKANLRKKYPPFSLDEKLIYMSSVTDPYQPIERRVKLTRAILDVLAAEHRPKLVVQTRSPDVVHDLDLYRRIEERGGRVQINMTVTTDSESVRRTFEPWCPSNAKRLEAIKVVAKKGIQTCVTMTPLLWLDNPEKFAKALVDTGVRRFISQPFHFKKGKFVAQTRVGAFQLMAEKLGCSIESFSRHYLHRYQRDWRPVLEHYLQRDGLTLGEGKHGFAPPF